LGMLGMSGVRSGRTRRMAQIPWVTGGRVRGTAGSAAAGVAVGSPGWFAWLADDAARSFSFRSPSGAYTARKERRQRGGTYWVAYRTVAGRQHKLYLGKAEDLNLERLDAAGAALAGRATPAARPPPQALPGQGRGPQPRAPGRGGRRPGRARHRRRRPAPAGDQAVRAPAPPGPGPATAAAGPPGRGPGRGPVLAALGTG